MKRITILICALLLSVVGKAVDPSVTADPQNNWLPALRNGFAPNLPAGSKMGGVLISTGSGPILTGNILYVDAVNGVDATGVRGRLDKPFLTLTAAKTAASSGDTIHVGPGSYSLTENIAKNGVNWHFEPGASVTGSGSVGIFDDSAAGANGAVSFTVSGRGVFTYSGSTAAKGVLVSTNAGSNVVLYGRTFANSSNSSTTAAIRADNGTVSVNSEEITSTGSGNGIWWANGNSYIRSHSISVTITGQNAVYSAPVTTPAGKLWVNADEISTSSNRAAIYHFASDADGTAWIFAKEIRSAAVGEGTVTNSAGKLYITAQKILNTASGGAGIHIFGGRAWVDCQKISAVTNHLSVVAGEFRGNILEFESAATITDAILIEGGVSYLSGQSLIAASGNGVRFVSTGTLYLTNLLIDTSADATSANPIVFEEDGAASTLVLNGVQLISEGTRFPISSPVAATVASYNSTANLALDTDIVITGNISIAGAIPAQWVSDTAYDATTWNGNTGVPTKNVIRDKIETLGSNAYTSTAYAPLNSPTFTGTVTTPNLTISGNQSAAAWTTSGLRIVGVAGTLTDTTSSGTVAAAYTNKLGGNTIAASSATTFTDYISLYLSEPVAGTNVTLTNKWALGADSLKVGTSNAFKVSSAGNVTVAGTLTLPSASIADAALSANVPLLNAASTIFSPSANSTTTFTIGGGGTGGNANVNFLLKAPSTNAATSGNNNIQFWRGATEVWEFGVDTDTGSGAKTSARDFYLYDGSAYVLGVKVGGDTKIGGNFTTSGGTITGGSTGLTLNTGGTNQNITLTPSGTGKGVINSPSGTTLLDVQANTVSKATIDSTGLVTGKGFVGNTGIPGVGGFGFAGGNGFYSSGNGMYLRTATSGAVAEVRDLKGINIDSSLLLTFGSIGLNGTTGIGQNATAVLEVNTGTLGQWASLKLGTRDSGTNTITNGLTLGHQSTGTPAAGLGEAILFNLDSTTTADQAAGSIYTAWTTATHASRTAKWGVRLVNNAAALADAFLVFPGSVRVTIGAAPSSPAEGEIYGDSTDHHLYYYNGTAWKQLDN